MKKTSRSPNESATSTLTGRGGETHQTHPTKSYAEMLTTNQGVVVADNQNSLKSSEKGSTLLEDFILREKITHFDHERNPERIVHARGSGAHGFFESYGSISDLTKAAFLQGPKKKTEVFARFSTVAGGAGSGDMPRDVRGFSVKFYTEEGNFDFVGNNIPVFFIQDAIKFPDLVHSVKMEPDRGFPQAASAHDTFWDFASLMPESMHMLMWTMSDRAIPRSLRMIEGFGVHTFRLVNSTNQSTFVKFHWRPLLQASSVLWDEAVKINGADPDFHRRDLWEAIERGDFPEYEFSVQAFDQEMANSLPFDVLDSTKLIPEELIPLRPIGKMTLNRNPDNFFAETEQVAFHPGHIVPGIDFSNDPLLQGRLHSYTDTQLSRLGGPNFHEIPINRPRCPMHNFQRDGLHRMDVPKGRVAYEPNSLAPTSARENPEIGFSSFKSEDEGTKLRIRPESFGDHYSQARLFYRSNNKIERGHIQEAFAFELSKVETPAIRTRMLGHLALIDEDLLQSVEELMGMTGKHDNIKSHIKSIEMISSPTLSILDKFVPTIKGRKLGIILGDGFSEAMLTKLKKAFLAEECVVEVITKKIGGAISEKKSKISGDHIIAGAPSILFDYLAILTSPIGLRELENEITFQDWANDGFNHFKVFGVDITDGNKQAISNLPKTDLGVIKLSEPNGIQNFIDMAKLGRHWVRNRNNHVPDHS